MTRTESILNWIRSELAPHGRKTKISKLTGIHTVTLAQVSKPDWNPSAATMQSIEQAIVTLFPAEPDTSQPQD